MKKILSFLLVLLLLAALCVPICAVEESDDSRNISYLSGADPDTAWFELDSGKAEYTLTSAAEFLGFRDLVNCGITFQNVTIKLGCDIVINEGDAAKWTVATNGLVEWVPIGHDKNGSLKTFKGTFDGQGHFISGIYQNSLWAITTQDGSYMRGRDGGLFHHCTGATIKNFAIVNSVFINDGMDSGASQGNSSVVTRAKSTQIENVYSDAYIVGGFAAGAIVGYMQGSGSSVKNCVYTGVIDLSKNTNGYSGGLVGCDDSSSGAVIEDCLFAGKVIASNAYGALNLKGMGGIIGYNKTVRISRCVSAGALESNRDWGFDWSAVSCSLSGATATVENVYYQNTDVLTAKADSYAASGKATYTNVNAISLEDLCKVDQTPALGNEWTRVEGELPMPTATCNLLAAMKDIDFATLKTPEENPPEDESTDTGEDNTVNEPATTEENQGDDSDGGCASVVGGSAIVVILCGFGIAAVAVKKRDRSAFLKK